MLFSIDLLTDKQENELGFDNGPLLMVNFVNLFLLASLLRHFILVGVFCNGLVFFLSLCELLLSCAKSFYILRVYSRTAGKMKKSLNFIYGYMFGMTLKLVSHTFLLVIQKKKRKNKRKTTNNFSNTFSVYPLAWKSHWNMFKRQLKQHATQHRLNLLNFLVDFLLSLSHTRFK